MFDKVLAHVHFRGLIANKSLLIQDLFIEAFIVLCQHTKLTRS